MLTSMFGKKKLTKKVGPTFPEGKYNWTWVLFPYAVPYVFSHHGAIQCLDIWQQITVWFPWYREFKTKVQEFNICIIMAAWGNVICLVWFFLANDFDFILENLWVLCAKLTCVKPPTWNFYVPSAWCVEFFVFLHSQYVWIF